MPPKITTKMKMAEPEWKMDKLQTMKPVFKTKNVKKNIKNAENVKKK